MHAQAAQTSERAAAAAQAQIDALREETAQLVAAVEEKAKVLSVAGEAASAAERELAQVKEDLAGQLEAAKELASTQAEAHLAKLQEVQASRDSAKRTAMETATELNRLTGEIEALKVEIAEAREKLVEGRVAEEALAEARAQV